MRPRPGSASGGFTLVEVLVAVSVLGVTMTAAFTLFSAGMKLRAVTRERMAFDRDARLIVGALMDDLANLVPAGPAPLVSADSIVLWRRQRVIVEDAERAGVPQLVTYQWAGSALQDSMLVRVATPLAVDVADSALVHAMFLKWARVAPELNADVRHLLREDPAARFGSRATLNGLSGNWLAFPEIRGFACGITEDQDGDPEADARSRIVVRLSPEPGLVSLSGSGPLTSLALLTDNDAAVEVGLWLPLTAKVPIPMADAPAEGVLP